MADDDEYQLIIILLWKLLNHFMSWIWNIHFIKLKQNKNKTDDTKCMKIRAFDLGFAYSYYYMNLW